MPIRCSSWHRSSDQTNRKEKRLWIGEQRGDYTGNVFRCDRGSLALAERLLIWFNFLTESEVKGRKKPSGARTSATPARETRKTSASSPDQKQTKTRLSDRPHGRLIRFPRGLYSQTYGLGVAKAQEISAAMPRFVGTVLLGGLIRKG